MSDKKEVWHVGSLNIQAGLSTHCYRDYFTKSWHHVSPTSKSKHQNLFSVGGSVGHLDVFGVQEVDPGSLRSGFSNQAHFLAEHGKFDHFTYQANRSTGLSTTANALFSKHELLRVQNIKLPSRKTATSPRGVLLSHIDTPKGPIAVGVAHLSLHPLDRKHQSEAIMQALKNEERVLLMGDFNDTPSSLSLASLKEGMDGHTTSATYPRWKPSRCIDVIWWRNLDVLEENSRVWGATDHCGVDIKFKL